VSRTTAALLTVCLCVMMAVPAALEVFVNPQPGLIPLFRQDLKTFGFQLTLQEVEKHLVYASQFASAVRQPYQRFLVAWFGQGSRTVVVGKDGYLFHRTHLVNTSGPGIRSDGFLRPPRTGPDIVDVVIKRVLGRGRADRSENAGRDRNSSFADSLTVLTAFHHALERRGVHLVLVGVPNKLTVYPERLRPEYPVSEGPAWNADYPEWRRRLVQEGVDYVDLTEPFWEQKDRGEAPLFLPLDTHWSPRGVAVAAQIVADRVRGYLGPYPPLEVSSRVETIVEPADLIALLGLRRAGPLFPEGRLQLTEVVPDAAVPTGDAAPVLLFGDSLSGYYDLNESSGLGQRGGFAWQLMLELKTGVQRFVGFGQTLPLVIQETFDTHPNLLTHKRVVVMEFHIGQLAAKTFSFRFSVP